MSRPPVIILLLFWPVFPAALGIAPGMNALISIIATTVPAAAVVAVVLWFARG